MYRSWQLVTSCWQPVAVHVILMYLALRTTALLGEDAGVVNSVLGFVLKERMLSFSVSIVDSEGSQMLLQYMDIVDVQGTKNAKQSQDLYKE